MQIKNIEKAAQRIEKAIFNKERIILYPDCDLDGAVSGTILKEAIEMFAKQMGIEPDIVMYFYDRQRDGYGINDRALDYLANHAPALFIALDCGMGNVQEVERAKSLGFEVMIVDHHRVPPGALPDASIVVNPRQESDPYPFKELAGAGVVYRLIQCLLGLDSKKAGIMQRLFFAKRTTEIKEFIGLVALATLADQMPLKDENKELVEQGLLELKNTNRVGLKILMDIAGFSASAQSTNENPLLEQVRQNLLTPLNSGRLDNNQHESYLLFTEQSLERAEKIAEKLIERAAIRKQEISRIVGEVEALLKEKKSESLVFEGDASWPLFYLGSAASKLCQRLNLPIFIFEQGPELSRGAVRVPKGIDSVKAMSNCAELLDAYGGHPPASGFTIQNKNLEKFKECLIKYFSNL